MCHTLLRLQNVPAPEMRIIPCIRMTTTTRVCRPWTHPSGALVPRRPIGEMLTSRQAKSPSSKTDRLVLRPSWRRQRIRNNIPAPFDAFLVPILLEFLCLLAEMCARFSGARLLRRKPARAAKRPMTSPVRGAPQALGAPRNNNLKIEEAPCGATKFKCSFRYYAQALTRPSNMIYLKYLILISTPPPDGSRLGLPAAVQTTWRYPNTRGFPKILGCIYSRVTIVG
jgi:hypothetical protein